MLGYFCFGNLPNVPSILYYFSKNMISTWNFTQENQFINQMYAKLAKYRMGASVKNYLQDIELWNSGKKPKHLNKKPLKIKTTDKEREIKIKSKAKNSKAHKVNIKALFQCLQARSAPKNTLKPERSKRQSIKTATQNTNDQPKEGYKLLDQSGERNKKSMSLMPRSSGNSQVQAGNKQNIVKVKGKKAGKAHNSLKLALPKIKKKKY